MYLYCGELLEFYHFLTKLIQTKDILSKFSEKKLYLIKILLASHFLCNVFIYFLYKDK